MSEEEPPVARLRALLERLGRELAPAGQARVVETHISLVLLAGAFACKFKKPVRLPFLDFRELSARRRMCEEELRLNRRLAPQIYLDVVAVTGSDEAPVLGGTGAPIEYAVRMRRFDPAAELGRLLAAGGVRVEHVLRLAADVAAFHERAPPAPAGSEWGTAAAVYREAMDNLDALARVRPPLDAGLLDALRESTAATLARCAPCLARRREGGRVRECHGDMHLGNMVLLDGRVVVFDCIEFNEAFRFIDVMSEAAFLLMDLDYRGHARFGRLFLSRYLEHTGDYAGLQVLGHYLAYRALVRAKVACIRATQAPGAAPASAARHDVDAHLELARAYLESGVYARGRTAPTLVITHGLSGSGKSWLAERVLAASGAVRIRSDSERRRVAPASAGTRAQRYTVAAVAATYARVAQQARIALRAGYPVIADATFGTRAERQRFRTLAHELGVPFAVLHADAAPAVLETRVARRHALGDDASEADLAVLARQRAAWQPLHADERRVVVRVDTSTQIDGAAVAAALAAAARVPRTREAP